MASAEHHGPGMTHDRAWALLPWYHNESLAADEHAAVRDHLGSCLTCTRELRRLAVLERAVAAPATEQACAQSFARLSGRIRMQRAPRWPQRLLGALRAVFEPVPLIAGASVLVFSSLLVATIVGNRDAEIRGGEQPFQTLGRHESGAVSELSHPLLRIVLRDELGAGGRRAWLQRHRAELVDGPSAIGVLTVRVAMGPRTFDAVLAEIRGDADTLFVEPVKLIGTRPDRAR